MFVFGGNNGGIRDDYKINNSLRFRSSASAYLTRTPASNSTSTTIRTFSAWVKRGLLSSSSRYNLFYQGVSAGSGQFFSIEFYNDSIRVLYDGVATYALVTNAVFRDPSAWYHIVIASDTTQATSSDRTKIYINGVLQTITGTQPTQNYTAVNGTTSINNVGNVGTTHLDGYLAEVNFIDGQALTPSSFGYTHPKTGVWRPKPYTGTYGTNGFYLKFSDIATTSGSNAGLGKDFSGNGNYYNTTNISVTAGTTYDAMIDSPTLGGTATQPAGNYATLNPNAKASSITLSEANLKSVDASGSFTVAVFATQTVFDKCYWEFQITSVGANAARGTCGVLPSNYTPTTFANDTLSAGITALGANSVGMCPEVSAIYQNGATTGISTGSWVANDVIMIAYNNGKLWMGRNGTWANSGDPAAGTGQVASGLDTSAMPVICNRNSQTWYANFGQRPFSYTPPTGFKSLCTSNLPNVTIPKGNKYMDATTYTSTGTTQTVTNSGIFKPDFVWQKARNNIQNHYLMDSVRGASQYLSSNRTDAEGTSATFLTSFNSDGVTFGTGNLSNGWTNVIWQWQAGQGTTSSNTNGSITSTVSVNTTAGFSIVTYTGTGANATVGHGLGVAPKMIIARERNVIQDWVVYHASVGATKDLFLNLTSAATTSTDWNNTTPTSSVFSVGTGAGVNGNTQAYVAYCFAEIAGFSAFGSYTGNGSTNGPFVYLGFRPKFVMFKRTDSSTSADWTILDSVRDTYNEERLVLDPNISAAEVTGSSGVYRADFLSNGFKIRGTSVSFNASSATYIYMAFAENPTKYALAR